MLKRNGSSTLALWSQSGCLVLSDDQLDIAVIPSSKRSRRMLLNEKDVSENGSLSTESAFDLLKPSTASINTGLINLQPGEQILQY